MYLIMLAVVALIFSTLLVIFDYSPGFAEAYKQAVFNSEAAS